MQIQGSCAARDGDGVLLIGPSGSGKSDLVLRLLDRGFALVADDQVEIDECTARPVAALTGLLEIRGLGLLRLDHRASAQLAVVIQLGEAVRLPRPQQHPLGLPMVTVDARAPSAAAQVEIALDCALGRRTQLVGAFAP